MSLSRSLSASKVVIGCQDDVHAFRQLPQPAKDTLNHIVFSTASRSMIRQVLRQLTYPNNIRSIACWTIELHNLHFTGFKIPLTELLCSLSPNLNVSSFASFSTTLTVLSLGLCSLQDQSLVGTFVLSLKKLETLRLAICDTAPSKIIPELVSAVKQLPDFRMLAVTSRKGFEKWHAQEQTVKTKIFELFFTASILACAVLTFEEPVTRFEKESSFDSLVMDAVDHFKMDKSCERLTAMFGEIDVPFMMISCGVEYHVVDIEEIE